MSKASPALPFPACAPEVTSAPPRLPPSDGYAGFWLALLRSTFRWTLGTVMMPLRVIFPRIPGYAFVHLCQMLYLERGVTLPRPLKHLIAIRVSRNNGCSFCYDAHQAVYMLDGPRPEALQDATRTLDDPALDAPTRAVLAYSDEVVHQGEVSDRTFAELQAHFGERQIVEIVWVAALSIYLNMLARPLRVTSDGLCALAQAKLDKL